MDIFVSLDPDPHENLCGSEKLINSPSNDFNMMLGLNLTVVKRFVSVFFFLQSRVPGKRIQIQWDLYTVVLADTDPSPHS